MVDEEDIQIAQTLDTVGLFCPVPLFKTREGIDSIQVNEVLEVLADDPAAEEDLKRFCKRTGHELLNFENDEGDLRFLIKRTK